MGARLIGGAGRWVGVAAAGSGMEDSLPAVAVPCGEWVGVTAAPSAGSKNRCFGSTRSSGMVTAGGGVGSAASRRAARVNAVGMFMCFIGNHQSNRSSQQLALSQAGPPISNRRPLDPGENPLTPENVYALRRRRSSPAVMKRPASALVGSGTAVKLPLSETRWPLHPRP